MFGGKIIINKEFYHRVFIIDLYKIRKIVRYAIILLIH